MAEVFELKQGKQFSLAGARAMLPLIKRITDEAVLQMELLKDHIEDIDPDPAHHPYYERELSAIVEKWAQKIMKLGCMPKGMWLVDFDNGEGFYCWHYPEEDVEFFHSYAESFANRTPIL